MHRYMAYLISLHPVLSSLGERERETHNQHRGGIWLGARRLCRDGLRELVVLLAQFCCRRYLMDPSPGAPHMSQEKTRDKLCSS